MGSINVMFIVALAILIITAILGYRKGLLMTLYSIVAIVFIIIVEYLFQPIVRVILEKYTNLSVGVEEVVRQYIAARYEPGTVMYGALTSPEVISGFVNPFAKGVSIFMTLFIAIVIAVLIGALIKKIGNVDMWKAENKILGAILGIFKGLIFVWAILYIGELINFTQLGEAIITQTNNSAVLSIINEFNILHIFLG